MMDHKRIIFIMAITLFVLFNKDVGAANWYLDKDAIGSKNGISWTNAWTSFSSVVWGAGGVSPGDTLYISGGTTSKTYTATGIGMLTVGASGTNDSTRITIATGAKSPSPTGHDGQVIFDGNANYLALINADGRSYITIDGEKNGAINWKIFNASAAPNETNGAVHIGAGPNNKVLYLEIERTSNGIMMQSHTYGEIGYCNLHDIRCDSAIRAVGSNAGATSYDRTLIHHNTIQINRDSSFYGADGVKCAEGISLYNNTFSTSLATTTCTQHPDFIETNGGRYVKIYNNTFKNIGDSAIDMADFTYAGTWGHVQIYNNLFYNDSDHPYGPGYHYESFRMYNFSVTALSDVHIVNNTFVDILDGNAVAIPFFTGNPGASNFNIKNNIFYNCGWSGGDAPIYIASSSGWVPSDFSIDYNSIYAGAHGSTGISVDGSSVSQAHGQTGKDLFVSYVERSKSNDYRLSDNDTVAKNTGITLSSIFTSDKNGLIRPNTGWSLGAYQFQNGMQYPQSPKSFRILQ
jgi:hypothetical protein